MNIKHIHLSGIMLNEMKERFASCQQMMAVSNEDLDVYHQKRQDMTKASVADSVSDALLQEMIEHNALLQKARQSVEK